jgi:ATP-binding cassette subfamily F protein uup
LDLSAIRWLSDLIKDRPKITLLTVTHDRFFLEDVCNTIIELDRGSLYSYEGNYATFLEKKAERLSIEDANVRSAKSKYRVELEWMRRQPQARATKSKARQDAFYTLEKSTKPRPVDSKIEVDKDGQRRLGNNVLKLKNVNLKFGDEKVILDDFSYNFNKGDKLGVVGANGIGKSTFIKVLTGQQTIDSGEIETGDTVVFGIYDQMGIEMDEDQRVMDFVKQRVEARDGSSMAEAPQEAMKLLKQFQFDRTRWQERFVFCQCEVNIYIYIYLYLCLYLYPYMSSIDFMMYS